MLLNHHEVNNNGYLHCFVGVTSQRLFILFCGCYFQQLSRYEEAEYESFTSCAYLTKWATFHGRVLDRNEGADYLIISSFFCCTEVAIVTESPRFICSFFFFFR